MTLHFQDWYQGGFPDRELVVIDALKPILATVDVLDRDGNPILDNGQPRRPYPCAWLPDDYGARLPVIRVYRTGGTADTGHMVDPATVQVATIAETRAESWELAEYCRQWLLSFSRGGTVQRTDGSKTLIDSVEELVGPQLMPELNPDFRMVPLTFRVVCRKPRGLPDYAKARESLS